MASVILINIDENVNVALTSVPLIVTICELRSKLIVSLRAVRDTLRLVLTLKTLKSVEIRRVDV